MWQLHAEMKVTYRPDYNGICSAPPSTLPLDKVEVAGCLKLDEVFLDCESEVRSSGEASAAGRGDQFQNEDTRSHPDSGHTMEVAYYRPRKMGNTRAGCDEPHAKTSMDLRVFCNGKK